MFWSLWKKIELSIIKENWPCFNITSEVNFTVHSLLIPRILSSVNVKPTGVIKLFCDHPNLTWVHVNNIPLRPLSSITKGPRYAVTRNFLTSVHADIDFCHCLSPFCLNARVITNCMRLLKKLVVHFCNYTNRKRRFLCSIRQRNKNWFVCTSTTGTRFFEHCCHSRMFFKSAVHVNVSRVYYSFLFNVPAI